MTITSSLSYFIFLRMHKIHHFLFIKYENQYTCNTDNALPKRRPRSPVCHSACPTICLFIVAKTIFLLLPMHYSYSYYHSVAIIIIIIFYAAFHDTLLHHSIIKYLNQCSLCFIIQFSVPNQFYLMRRFFLGCTSTQPTSPPY